MVNIVEKLERSAMCLSGSRDKDGVARPCAQNYFLQKKNGE